MLSGPNASRRIPPRIIEGSGRKGFFRALGVASVVGVVFAEAYWRIIAAPARRERETFLDMVGARKPE